MLAKLAVLVQSKAAVAVLGAVLIGGTGATVAAATTGHLPFIQSHTTSSEQQSGERDDQGQNEVSLEGVLKSYDAAKNTITVLGEHDGENHAASATPSATHAAENEATPEATHAAGTEGTPEATDTVKVDAAPTTFAVDSKTKVNGDHASTLADLSNAVGHKVEVQAEKQSDGTLLARKVTVQGVENEGHQGDQHNKEVQGTVVAAAAASFVVKDETGKQVTVTVNAQTHFGGTLHSISDLKVGERVDVAGNLQSDGSVVATVVSVETDGATSGSGDQHEATGVHGSVVSVGTSSFVVKDETGKQITVTAGASTQFSGVAHSLSDLKAGELVEVAGTAQADGSVAAAMVMVQAATAS